MTFLLFRFNDYLFDFVGQDVRQRDDALPAHVHRTGARGARQSDAGRLRRRFRRRRDAKVGHLFAKLSKKKETTGNFGTSVPTLQRKLVRINFIFCLSERQATDYPSITPFLICLKNMTTHSLPPIPHSLPLIPHDYPLITPHYPMITHSLPLITP